METKNKNCFSKSTLRRDWSYPQCGREG